MSSPAVELQSVVAPNIPALSATQVETAVQQIKAVIAGKSLGQVLAALPGVVESTYALVQSFLVADQTAVSNVVLAIVVESVGVSGLPSQDVAVIDEVLTSLVPSLVTLVAKWAPELEEDVESCCTGCCSWLRSKF